MYGRPRNATEWCTMTPIDPTDIRYVKLGSGGRWARRGLAHGEVHFGYRTVPHDLCVREDWGAVAQVLMDGGRSAGKAADGVREIRDFYTLGADCLWVTFADGHLWWGRCHRNRLGMTA